VSQVEAHPIHDADDANGDVGEEDGFEGLPIVTNDRELLQRGICRVRIPEELDADRWAEELSQVTPMILGFEGDGEYAFYRNILDEPEFPFETILFGSCSRNSDDNKVEVITRAEEPEPITNGGVSEIGRSILECFPILPGNPEPATVKIDADATADRYSEILSRELRLDDAFCVHYNMDQDDTSGAKHMDPSDITINICLHKSKDARGSFVLFHGTKHLEQMHPNDDDESTDIKALIPIPAVPTILPAGKEDRFLVPQREGYATIHFGDHPHETTPLRRGSRTNIILTYLYTDPTRSDAASRSCY
jgi:hypothetical protein